MKIDPKSDNSELKPADFLIKDYVLVALDKDSLEIQIIFNEPQKITKNFIDPDNLVISFRFGKIFIDSEDF